MKNYIQSNKKGIILVFLGILIMVTAFVLSNNKTKEFNEVTMEHASNTPESLKVITEEEKLDLYLKEYSEEIRFYAKTFGIEEEALLNKLKGDYESIGLLDSEENIGKILIDYLLILEKEDSSLFNNNLVPCDASKEYMIALINYFSNIYGNVDFKIASAIAQIESNYSARSMLNKNNIFGGMSSGRLIGYKNIEYGILRYIKLLSEGYFAKGLTTVETIGRVYNPTYNENGVKIASPSWVRNVNNAISNYENNLDITNIAEIMELQVD